MAIYDLTSKSTAGVGADVEGKFRSDVHQAKMVKVEAYLDIAKMIAAGYTYASGDVFQLLEMPAGVLVLDAGAEVMTAFDGTSPVADVDFAGGDDIIDGAALGSTGYCAAGVNGQTRAIRGTAASTYAEFVAATDTIDVTLTGTSITTGVLRVYAVGVDLGEYGEFVPTEVSRDQLA